MLTAVRYMHVLFCSVYLFCFTITFFCLLTGPWNVFRHDTLLPHQQIRPGLQVIDNIPSNNPSFI